MANRRSGASWPNRDHGHHVLGLDKGHLQVQLRELRLPVRTKVLIAKTAGDLHVAVVAGDHQDLLVKLRRLRQGIKLALLDATGHEVVSGALRRAPAQHGRLHVDETQLIEVVPHQLDHPVPQDHGLLHFGPAEIDVAVLQPQFLGRQLLGAGLERRRPAGVENFQPLRANLDLPGGQLGVDVAFRPRGHLAGGRHHKFSPQRAGQFPVLFTTFGSEDDLRLAVPVAQIDKQHAAVVATGIHPAAQRHLPADVSDA